MTIWGTYVFAKPVGRCVQALRDLQAPESLPAMNNLIRTLDEYLQATDIKARDVFRKAIGRPTGGVLQLTHPDPQALPESLTDDEIKAIFNATCGAGAHATDWSEFGKFARAIEARVRMEMNAETQVLEEKAREELDEALRAAQLAQPADAHGHAACNGVKAQAFAEGK